jgi:putative transposase
LARLARIVLPGIPYHVTQRGNRRQQTFFEDGDFALYRDLLADGNYGDRCNNP